MSRRTAVSCFAACTLSLFAAVVPAAADSLIATIASDGTTVMSRPAEKSQVVSTAAAQTIVTIMDREGDWLWILLPPDVNGTRHAGWIRTRDVEGAISDVSAARLESGRPKSVSTRSRQRTDRRLQHAKDELEKAQRQYEKLTIASGSRPDAGSSSDAADRSPQK